MNIYQQTCNKIKVHSLLPDIYYSYFQIDKLIASGSDILKPIPIGPKRVIGTAVDYAYYLYNLVSTISGKRTEYELKYFSINLGKKRISSFTLLLYIFQDRRIAHMPYHALTHAERETFNARRQLLSHLGYIMRSKAVERERTRLEAEERSGRRSTFKGPFPLSDCESEREIFI